MIPKALTAIAKKNSTPLEFAEQKSLVKWLDLQHPHILYCASAGGMRTSQGTASKMKASGYKKGFPDLFIYEPRSRYHGLAIEMKRKKGGEVSEEQEKWIDGLNSRGYLAYVCYGFDEAKAVITRYLEQ